MMAAARYKLYELNEQAREKLALDPLPFPVRSRTAKSIFDQSKVPLQKLLREVDLFLDTYPEDRPRYRYNVTRLAMLCSGEQMEKGDLKGVFEAITIGLRADPVHGGLQLRKALALQIKGDHRDAAIGYANLLNKEPYAYDPAIRALAAKAFAASGDNARALDVLEMLPEEAFQDDGLAALRASLQEGKEKPTGKPAKRKKTSGRTTRKSATTAKASKSAAAKKTTRRKSTRKPAAK